MGKTGLGTTSNWSLHTAEMHGTYLTCGDPQMTKSHQRERGVRKREALLTSLAMGKHPLKHREVGSGIGQQTWNPLKSYGGELYLFVWCFVNFLLYTLAAGWNPLRWSRRKSLCWQSTCAKAERGTASPWQDSKPVAVCLGGLGGARPLSRINSS
jgi:hypothetical protein